ncbi:hypothetical protein PRIPAC_82784 [Pristionchus pacificus]|uniref:Uncharacterized protein n=1 Tax=Pristionchus pacificus TaxID=54126 RepID=A0A2A6BVE2_PRIPA|nr:hypothetical protein PRIPAC_82784 [Pristionchus pacificus]|eukprot:PDM69869.1 hypothetical protein PRIPAC_49081 [Pristionchus pacificus]
MNEWMVADALPTTYNGYSTYESECVATRKPRFISLVSTLAVIGGEIMNLKEPPPTTQSSGPVPVRQFRGKLLSKVFGASINAPEAVSSPSGSPSAVSQPEPFVTERKATSATENEPIPPHPPLPSPSPSPPLPPSRSPSPPPRPPPAPPSHQPATTTSHHTRKAPVEAPKSTLLRQVLEKSVVKASLDAQKASAASEELDQTTSSTNHSGTELHAFSPTPSAPPPPPPSSATPPPQSAVARKSSFPDADYWERLDAERKAREAQQSVEAPKTAVVAPFPPASLGQATSHEESKKEPEAVQQQVEAQKTAVVAPFPPASLGQTTFVQTTSHEEIKKEPEAVQQAISVHVQESCGPPPPPPATPPQLQQPQQPQPAVHKPFPVVSWERLDAERKEREAKQACGAQTTPVAPLSPVLFGQETFHEGKREPANAEQQAAHETPDDTSEYGKFRGFLAARLAGPREFVPSFSASSFVFTPAPLAPPPTPASGQISPTDQQEYIPSSSDFVLPPATHDAACSDEEFQASLGAQSGFLPCNAYFAPASCHHSEDELQSNYHAENAHHPAVDYDYASVWDDTHEQEVAAEAALDAQMEYGACWAHLSSDHPHAYGATGDHWDAMGDAGDDRAFPQYSPCQSNSAAGAYSPGGLWMAPHPPVGGAPQSASLSSSTRPRASRSLIRLVGDEYRAIGEDGGRDVNSAEPAAPAAAAAPAEPKEKEKREAKAEPAAAAAPTAAPEDKEEREEDTVIDWRETGILHGSSDDEEDEDDDDEGYGASAAPVARATSAQKQQQLQQSPPAAAVAAGVVPFPVQAPPELQGLGFAAQQPQRPTTPLLLLRAPPTFSGAASRSDSAMGGSSSPPPLATSTTQPIDIPAVAKQKDHHLLGSPPPPDPMPVQVSSLAHLFAPGWRREAERTALVVPVVQSVRPMQRVLRASFSSTPPSTPTSKKNLLNAAIKNMPPPKSHAQRMEEERKRENERMYDRFVRRLSLERRTTDGQMETLSRLEERDRLLTRREITVDALKKAVAEAPRTRSISHSGSWRMLEGDSASKSKWYKLEEERCDILDDLDVSGHQTDSLYTNDSLTSEPKERELDVDRSHLSWQRGFVIRAFLLSDTNTYEFEVFTLAGRCYVRTAQTEDLSTLRVKFALLPDGTAIVRKSSYCSSGLFSLNLRIGKLLKINSTAIVGYRHTGSTSDWIMWSDDIGLIMATDATVSKYDTDIRRTLPLMVPLRVVSIKMQAEHSSSRDRRIDPRAWEIHQIGEMTEESDLESLHDTAWPRLAQRVDDLQWVEMDGNKIYLRSPSFPERRIHCRIDQWMRTEKDEKNRIYRARRKFTAVMVPYQPHLSTRRDEWQCLLLAPISLVAEETENRIFNYHSLSKVLEARKQSLPEGWDPEASPAPYPVISLDLDSR